MALCARPQRTTNYMAQPQMLATMDALRCGLSRQSRQCSNTYKDEIIFPPKMYGEWSRLRYCVAQGKKKLIICNKPGQFTISFRRTLNDFVRCSQTHKMKRVSTTWITDGEWYDQERVIIDSETQFSREYKIGDAHCRETAQLVGNVLHLIGYNGRFWYRAVFRKNFYPMMPIPEIEEN